MSFGGESGLRKAGLGGIHPLTQRYTFWSTIDFNFNNTKNEKNEVITIVNDVDWGAISLLNFMNSWLPGIFTFFLGFLFEKWSSRRKLKTELKNNLLEIFIPTFNSGEVISVDLAESTNFKLKATLNAYKRIYPNTFNEKAVEELSKIFADGFMVGGEVNPSYSDADKVQDLIKVL